jgi:hypothetical protein
MSEWIPVSERLPKGGGYFAVLWKPRDFPHTQRAIATYSDTAWWVGASELRERVTHWTPLPEPPEAV